MKIIFMGTPDFAVSSLRKLAQDYTVSAVFTQPDRPKGRGNKISISPVKDAALQLNIPVYQPEKIKSDINCIKVIEDIKPDFIIVVAFGQILPKEILEIPKYGCINLHASLLPKYRGAAPINWAVINGEKISGNTTMLMDVGLDTGDMLLKNECIITPTMTAGELHDILMEDGASLLIETINGLIKNKIKPIKQDNSESTYASMLSKNTAKIDWNKSNVEIQNLIRGLNPWPIAYSNYCDEIMKIYEADLISSMNNYEPGQIIEVSKKGIEVATGSGNLLIKKIQFPGGKPLTVDEYLRGHEIKENIILS